MMTTAPTDPNAYSLLDVLGVPSDAARVCVAEAEETGESIDAVLLRNGFVSRQEITAARAKLDESSLMLSALYTTEIPVEVLRKHRITICGRTDQRLYAASPEPPQAIADYLAPWLHGRTLIALPFVPNHHEAFLETLEGVSREEDLEDPVDLVRAALHIGASDIHVLPKQMSYAVLMRVLGVVEHFREGSLDEHRALIARIKDRARMDVSEARIPQDGEFQIAYGDGYVDLRVVTVPTVFGEKAVIRVLDQQKAMPTLEDLGITQLEEWRAAIGRTDGLSLVVGPTGSGKTTTLNATLRELDRIGQIVYTAEYPVEYRVGLAGQVNVVPEVGMTYAAALRAFLRGDPDTIVSGETRDAETAAHLVQAAETGHRVLSTLHATTVRGIVQRLQNMGIPNLALRASMRGILNQRLVRTLCPEEHRGQAAAGCLLCRGTGYAGRMAISECVYLGDEHEVDRFLDSTVEQWWPSILDDAFAKLIPREKGRGAEKTTREELVRVFGARAVADYEAKRD